MDNRAAITAVICAGLAVVMLTASSMSCTAPASPDKGQVMMSIETSPDNASDNASDVGAVALMVSPGEAGPDTDNPNAEQGQVSLYVDDSGPDTSADVSNVSASSLTLNMPSGAEGPGVEYTFSVTPNNVPKGAAYTWWIKTTKVVSAQVNRRSVTFQKNGFRADNCPYEITVKAEWTDGNGRYRSAAAAADFNVGAVIKIIMPAEGTPDLPYSFRTQHDTVPKGAIYRWYIAGQNRGEAVNATQLNASPNFFQSGTYRIEVIARWLNAKQQELTARDSGLFTVRSPVPTNGTQTTDQQAGGEQITCPCCRATRTYYAADFHWLVNWARNSTYCKACGIRFCVPADACYGCSGSNVPRR